MTQPKALQLAESTHLGYRVSWQKATAAELRRLHEVNRMLVEAAEMALDALEIYGAQAPAVKETIEALSQALAKLKEKNT